MTRLYGAVRPGDWTDAEVAILREHAGKLPAAAIALLVNHTKHAVNKKIELLGLPTYYFWPADRLDDLRANGSQLTVAEFAARHGISHESARHMARKVGLRFIP